MAGYVKLHRQVLDNPIVCKDNDHLAVWIYILCEATHKKHPHLFMGEKIMLKPGQFTTGRKRIAAKLNISESKVQRILKAFESEQQIEQQNGNKNRLITVKNWGKYQASEQQNEQQVNNKRTTDEQQMNTEQECKEDKECKEGSSNAPTLEEIRAFATQRKSSLSADDFYKDNLGSFGEMRSWKAVFKWCERNQKKNPNKFRPTKNYDHLATNLFEGDEN
jgi:hypothetical protein